MADSVAGAEVRSDLDMLTCRVQDDQAPVIGLHRLVEVDRDRVRDPGQALPPGWATRL